MEAWCGCGLAYSCCTTNIAHEPNCRCVNITISDIFLVLLGSHGSASLRGMIEKNKMATTYSVLVFKR